MYIHKYRALYEYDDPLADLKPYIDDYAKQYLPEVFQNSEIISNNLHTLVVGITLYTILFQLSKLLLLIPSIHDPLKNTKNRLDFCVRVVSFIQAIIICILGIPVFNNTFLNDDRVYATTPYSKFYTAMALSYFIWDTAVTSYYVKYFGFGFLIHGIVSTLVFTIALENGFIHYYSAIFLLFEISTPFLDIRWIGLKFKVLNETIELINNIILILIFFFVRICWGWYQVARLAVDLHSVKHEPGFPYIGASIILSCNIILDILNMYWFGKMMTVAIETLKQMFGYSAKNTDNNKLKLM
jgi:hypothetical protein